MPSSLEPCSFSFIAVLLPHFPSSRSISPAKRTITDEDDKSTNSPTQSTSPPPSSAPKPSSSASAKLSTPSTNAPTFPLRPSSAQRALVSGALPAIKPLVPLLVPQLRVMPASRRVLKRRLHSRRWRNCLLPQMRMRVRMQIMVQAQSHRQRACKTPNAINRKLGNHHRYLGKPEGDSRGSSRTSKGGSKTSRDSNKDNEDSNRDNSSRSRKRRSKS